MVYSAWVVGQTCRYAVAMMKAMSEVGPKHDDGKMQKGFARKRLVMLFMSEYKEMTVTQEGVLGIKMKFSSICFFYTFYDGIYM